MTEEEALAQLIDAYSQVWQATKNPRKKTLLAQDIKWAKSRRGRLKPSARRGPATPSTLNRLDEIRSDRYQPGPRRPKPSNASHRLPDLPKTWISVQLGGLPGLGRGR
jgi:hypothetical protein